MSRQLKWSPPELTDPVTINLGQGQTSNALDNGTDYIINLPPYVKLGVTEFVGGRNLHIIGGSISVPGSTYLESPAVTHFSALHIKGQQGTVHIEGIEFSCVAGGHSWDCVYTNCPSATVQIQNCRVNQLKGDEPGHHADIFQIGDGCGELRMDMLTGSTNYQGIFLKTNPALAGLGRYGKMYFSRINIKADPGPDNQSLLFMEGLEDDVYFEDVYLLPSSYPHIIVPVESLWDAFVHGTVFTGAPDRSFVPAGIAGLNYRTPGYQS